MKRTTDKLKFSGFTANVFKLFTGTAIAQLIPFIVLPFLQKYFYSPAEFAAFAAFNRIAELFMLVSVMRLEQGIVLTKTKPELMSIFKLIQRVLIIMSIISLLAVLVFNDYIAVLLDEKDIKNYLYLIPIMVICYGLFITGYYYLNKMGKFGVMARSKVVQVLSSETTKLITGFLSFSVLGLILGRLLGIVLSFVYIIFPFFKSRKELIREKQASTVGVDVAYKKHKDFMWYTTPSTLIGTLISVITLTIIIYYFGKDLAGNFAVSLQYIAAFFGVLSVSFGQVYFNRISNIDSRSEMRRVYVQWAKRLFIVSCVIVVGLYLIPNRWIISILGEQWSTLLPISRILIWGLAVQFVPSALSLVYARLNRQKYMLFFDIAHIILIVAGLFFGYTLTKTIEGMLWVYTSVQILFYISTFIVAIYFINTSKMLTNESTVSS